VSSSVRKQRKKLNLTEQEGCEGLLNKAECPKALKDMECNKTPGSDGLQDEFYKVFWNDISDLFLNSINYAYRIGQLSVTQRRGIIKLIPKKNTHYSNMDSESNQQSSQKSHKMFGDFNIFSVMMHCLHIILRFMVIS